MKVNNIITTRCMSQLSSSGEIREVRPGSPTQVIVSAPSLSGRVPGPVRIESGRMPGRAVPSDLSGPGLSVASGYGIRNRIFESKHREMSGGTARWIETARRIISVFSPRASTSPLNLCTGATSLKYVVGFVIYPTSRPTESRHGSTT